MIQELTLKHKILQLKADNPRMSQKEIETHLNITHGQLTFALYAMREKRKVQANKRIFNVSKRQNWLI